MKVFVVNLARRPDGSGDSVRASPRGWISVGLATGRAPDPAGMYSSCGADAAGAADGE